MKEQKTPEWLEILFDVIEGQSGTTLTNKQKDSFRFLLADQVGTEVLARCAAFYRSPEAGMRSRKIPVAGDLIHQPKDVSAMAAALCRKTIAEVGGNKSIRFEDGRINAVVSALGGWATLCDKSKSELERLFAYEFKGLYESVAPSNKSLPGRHELKSLSAHALVSTLVIECPWIGKTQKSITAVAQEAIENGRNRPSLPLSQSGGTNPEANETRGYNVK